MSTNSLSDVNGNRTFRSPGGGQRSKPREKDVTLINDLTSPTARHSRSGALGGSSKPLRGRKPS